MGLKLELLDFLGKLFIGNEFFFFQIFNFKNLDFFSMFAFSCKFLLIFQNLPKKNHQVAKQLPLK